MQRILGLAFPARDIHRAVADGRQTARLISDPLIRQGVPWPRPLRRRVCDAPRRARPAIGPGGKRDTGANQPNRAHRKPPRTDAIPPTILIQGTSCPTLRILTDTRTAWLCSQSRAIRSRGFAWNRENRAISAWNRANRTHRPRARRKFSHVARELRARLATFLFFDGTGSRIDRTWSAFAGNRVGNCAEQGVDPCRYTTEVGGVQPALRARPGAVWSHGSPD
jgi:hypothetical protein